MGCVENGQICIWIHNTLLKETVLKTKMETEKGKGKGALQSTTYIPNFIFSFILLPVSIPMTYLLMFEVFLLQLLYIFKGCFELMCATIIYVVD